MSSIIFNAVLHAAPIIKVGGDAALDALWE